MRRAALTLLLALAAALAVGCNSSNSSNDATGPIRFSGPAQGTTYRITVMQPGTADADQVRAAVRGVIDAIDAQMSTWRDDSEIARFNAANADTWVAVSDQLAQLTKTALAIGRRTDGAFDVTLGPILKAWGFGADADAPGSVPSAAALAAARAKTGIGLIRVRTDPPALRKTEAGTTLDLAGIAQGFTVDRIAAALDRLGASHYLVELGGELFARDGKSDSRAWRIGVEKPESGTRAVERVVRLKDAGMTTSGDYRDYFEIDGHRYSHTIDPRTGRPVAHDLHAVTVIADSAMTADAMATALLVMGPKPGLRYANDHGLAVLFVSGHKGAYSETSSQAFEPYLEETQ